MLLNRKTAQSAKKIIAARSCPGLLPVTGSA